jgi:hypothetical protein
MSVALRGVAWHMVVHGASTRATQAPYTHIPAKAKKTEGAEKEEEEEEERGCAPPPSPPPSSSLAGASTSSMRRPSTLWQDVMRSSSPCAAIARLVIKSRWVSTPLAFAGQMQPRRLNV